MTVKEKIQHFCKETVRWTVTTNPDSITLTLINTYFAAIHFAQNAPNQIQKVLQVCTTPTNQNQLKKILDQLPTEEIPAAEINPTTPLLLAFRSVLTEEAHIKTSTPQLTIIAAGIHAATHKTPFTKQCFNHFLHNGKLEHKFLAQRLQQHLDENISNNPFAQFIEFAYFRNPIAPFLRACADQHYPRLGAANITKTIPHLNPNLWIIFGFDAGLDLAPYLRQGILNAVDPHTTQQIQAFAQTHNRLPPNPTDQELLAALLAPLPNDNFNRDPFHNMGFKIRASAAALHYGFVAALQLQKTTSQT